MPILGDDRKLQLLLESLKRAPERAPAAAAKACAPEVGALLRGEARRAQAPDGTPWAPLKRGSGKPLRGILDGMTEGTDGGRVVVQIPHKAAKYHQSGTRYPAGRAVRFVRRHFGLLLGALRMPARELVPGGKGLPPTWRRRLVPRARGAVNKVIREG